MGHIKILEDLDFHNIVISLKSSDIYKTVDAYELISKKLIILFILELQNLEVFTKEQ